MKKISISILLTLIFSYLSVLHSHLQKPVQIKHHI